MKLSFALISVVIAASLATAAPLTRDNVNRQGITEREVVKR